MKKAVVLLADGFEEVEAVTPIDFLRRAGCDVTVAGVSGDVVTGAHGIKIRTDSSVPESHQRFDAVIVPGGMPGAENVAASTAAIELLKATNDSGALVAAICAAPAVVLAANGLLNGKRATCYPGFEAGFEKANQKGAGIDFSTNRVVGDGNLITSRGPGTAAEFALAIVRYLVGGEAADTLYEGTLQK